MNALIGGVKRFKLTDIRYLVIYLFLTFWCVVILLPIYWMIITAIKPPLYVLEMPPVFYPRNPTLKNFSMLFFQAPILRWFLNSVIVTASLTVGAVLVDSMAAFSYAIVKPKGHMFFCLLILACMMIPEQIRILPLYIFLTNLGWTDKYVGIIIPFMGSAFGMYMLRQYMRGISREFIDAASIEGCGLFRIYARIVMPLSKPVLAVVVIFIFTGNWNSLLWPMILTKSANMRTLTVGLATIQGQYNINYGTLMAGACVSALPIIALFLPLQKHFTKGITLGGIKG